MINLALFMLVYATTITQPSVTISWNTPFNGTLVITNYCIYSGQSVSTITNLEANTKSNSIIMPVTTDPRFWRIRAVNELGLISQ